jgi:hypothetical protein
MIKVNVVFIKDALCFVLLCLLFLLSETVLTFAGFSKRCLYCDILQYTVIKFKILHQQLQSGNQVVWSDRLSIPVIL